MSKPTIRVTTLEAFRRFRDNSIERDYFEIPEQRVIDTVRGTYIPNEYARIGTAFHKIVENGRPDFMESNGDCTVVVDGKCIRFDANQLRIALGYRDEHPGAFHEIRRFKDYGRAVVTGCADLIDGIEINDTKTRYSVPKDREYIESAQWKFYLEIFQSDVFHFNVFTFVGYKPAKHGYCVRGLELIPHTPPITCYRYPDMESQNLALVNEFMDWAESRGLVGYLTEAQIRR